MAFELGKKYIMYFHRRFTKCAKLEQNEVFLQKKNKKTAAKQNVFVHSGLGSTFFMFQNNFSANKSWCEAFPYKRACWKGGNTNKSKSKTGMENKGCNSETQEALNRSNSPTHVCGAPQSRLHNGADWLWGWTWPRDLWGALVFVEAGGWLATVAPRQAHAPFSHKLLQSTSLGPANE